MSGAKFHSSIVNHIWSNDSNIIFSPWSIFSLLTLTSAGSDGKTLDEFLEVLKVNKDRIHEVMKNRNQYLMGGNKQLSIANAFFSTLKPLPSFQEICRKNYLAECFNTTFPEPGLTEVNNFVEQRTNGLIKSVLDSLSRNTRMILVNAIHFKGKWETEFKKRYTRVEDFDLFGKKLRVSYMSREDGTESCGQHNIKGTKFQSCSLDYIGNRFSMLFLKPEQEGKKALKKLQKLVSSDPKLIDTIYFQENERKLGLLLIPRFTIESSIDLKKVLKKMGLKSAFSKNANFSNMFDQKKENVCISKIVQKAKITVDEEGTEAAAASVSCCLRESCSNSDFLLDRPFLCFIIHNETKNVLFSSKVVHPVYQK